MIARCMISRNNIMIKKKNPGALIESLTEEQFDESEPEDLFPARSRLD